MSNNDMKNNNLNSLGIDESLFELELDMPDTSELKSRIMQLTAAMPQQLNTEINDFEASDLEQKVSFLSKLFEYKFVAPLAVAASVALVAVLWVPSAPQQTDVYYTGDDAHLAQTSPDLAKAEALLAAAEAPITAETSITAEASIAAETSIAAEGSISAEAPFTIDDDLDFEETMVFFDEQMFVQR